MGLMLKMRFQCKLNAKYQADDNNDKKKRDPTKDTHTHALKKRLPFINIGAVVCTSIKKTDCFEMLRIGKKVQFNE